MNNLTRAPRPHSLYELQCVCGAIVQQPHLHGKCPSCGRIMSVQWPAKYKSTKEKYD